ncbi:hypothetical protein K435DRAFT_838166 [Dendrothele bispora CBS 962.96]|uniref:RING-type domain-containing protein n=1 Tax=Dendrothele bispora (strain CBS 962.96) TaxID=1314807 RepID=A0A4S8M7R7_DENBC|nr:hypothetical protein K435DRAFT_838166 [Dendrothele bispora CBS 962.96]
MDAGGWNFMTTKPPYKSRKRVRFEDEVDEHDHDDTEPIDPGRLNVGGLKRRKIDHSSSFSCPSPSPGSLSRNDSSRTGAGPSRTNTGGGIDLEGGEGDGDDGDDDFDMVKWQSLLHRLILPDSPVNNTNTSGPPNDDKTDAYAYGTASTGASTSASSSTSSSPTPSTSASLPNPSPLQFPLHLPPNVSIPPSLANWPLVLYTSLNEPLPSAGAGANAAPIRRILRRRRRDAGKWPEVVLQVLSAQQHVDNAGEEDPATSGLDVDGPGEEDSSRASTSSLVVGGHGGHADDEAEQEEEWSSESDEDIDEFLRLRSRGNEERDVLDDNLDHIDNDKLTETVTTAALSWNTSKTWNNNGCELDDRGQWEPSFLERPAQNRRPNLDLEEKSDYQSDRVQAGASKTGTSNGSSTVTASQSSHSNANIPSMSTPPNLSNSHHLPNPRQPSLHSNSTSNRSPPHQPPNSSTAVTSNLNTYRCPICLSPPINATLTPCGHVTCEKCLWKCIEASGYEPPLDDEVGDLSAVVASGGEGIGALFRHGRNGTYENPNEDEEPFSGYSYSGMISREREEGEQGNSWVHGDWSRARGGRESGEGLGEDNEDPGVGWRWRYRVDLDNFMNGDGRMRVWRERVRDKGGDREPRCPICRAVIPAWDGKGRGVIGLRIRVAS